MSSHLHPLRSWLGRPAVALLAAAALLPGCGAGAGEAVTGVTLTVSSGFGASNLKTFPTPKVAGEDTVLRLLQRNTEVESRDGGGFVTAINGTKSGAVDGEQHDWTYYVDGVAADRGAAAWRLRSGEQVWWDFHASDAFPGGTPAVVGAYPRPLAGGFDGRHPTTMIRCADPDRAACTTVTERLTAAGAKLVPGTPAGSPATDAGQQAPIQVIVARIDQLAGFGPEAASLRAGPEESGVFARITGDRTLEGLDQRGKTVTSSATSTGIVAAIRRSTNAPVWIVAGTDDQGLRRAAKALDEDQLRHRAAVIVDQRGARGIPEGPTG
ncbi:MAG: DUF4430 domain-containing protein [Solirubrobacteraceae bacterium]|nr:DUF4430 domain-containing protein [Solirubrobacteraceae bacterium]